MLNNLIPITCPTCSSKLQIKNKVFFSGIGGVGAGVGAGFGVLLLGLFFRTGNTVYLGLLGVLFVTVLLVASLLLVKFVKLKVEMPNHA